MSESMLYLDPAARARMGRRKWADQLMASSQDTSPIRGHSQGLARMAQALMAGLELGSLDREEKAADTEGRARLAQLQGVFAAPEPQRASAPVAMPDVQMPPQRERMADRLTAPMPAAQPAALQGNSARSINIDAGRQRDAIMADATLSPADQQAALARVSEARLVANGTPPRPGGYGGARGAWDDGMRAPTGAVNMNVAQAPSYGASPMQSPAQPPQQAPAMPDDGLTPQRAAALKNALGDPDPRVRQFAEGQIKVMALQRREPSTYPIIQTVGPQGEGQYERTPQGLKYVGPIVREPKEPPQIQTREMVVNGVPGVYTVGRDGRPIARIGEPYQAPQQPSENERLGNQWRELEKKRATVGLTPDEQLTFDDLSRMRQRPEQITAGPTGIAVMGPAPLPQFGAPGGGGGGLTVPMLNPAPGQAQPGLVTQPSMSQQPVTGSPMPGSDASSMPPVGARPALNMTTPGGRPINVQPAPQQPQANYQRAPDQSALEPIPGSPADPAVQVRTKALQSVPEAEAGANRVLDAINNFRAALDRAKGTTGLQVFNPRSPEGKDLQGAFELVKIALRDPTMINTGVLQPGEARMIDQMLMNPRSLEGLMAGNDAYKAMLDQFAGFAQRGADRVRGVAGMSPIDWTQPRQGVTQGPSQAGRLRYNPATGRIE